jgi:hypothetical protein
MRKIALILFAAVAFLFASCKSGSTPEAVAESFLKAVYTADFEKAKSLCTEESKQAIDFVAAFASQSVDDMKKAKVGFELISSTIAEDGNSAVVLAKVTGTLDLQKEEVIDEKDEKVKLVKVNDKWLVDYKLK